MKKYFKYISNKSLFIMIFSILSIILLSTYAWLTWRSSETALVLTIGDLGNINISLSPYKINTDIIPSTTYDGSDEEPNDYTQIDVVNSSSLNKYKVSLYYDIKSIEDELIDSSFKYTILTSEDNIEYTEYLTGNFSGATSESRYMILEDEDIVSNSNKYYRVYLWIDSTMGNQSSMQGKVFNAELRAEYSSFLESAEEVTEYNYTGDYQIYTVPVSGYYFIEAYGAQGGMTSGNTGYGAKSQGIIYLNKDENVYIYVGGAGDVVGGLSTGTQISGGYNGGGFTISQTGSGCESRYWGSGGGATDIRYFGSITPDENDLLWNSELGLNSRIMVAGGGGGCFGGDLSCAVDGSNICLGGGNGGTLIGEDATTNNGYVPGIGGTQTSGGKEIIGTSDVVNVMGGFGYGGEQAGLNSTGGGSGYYGGTSSGHVDAAGGGSSFISGYSGVNAITSSSDRTHTYNTLHYSNKYFIDGEMQGGVNSGDGKAKITYLGSVGPERINLKLDNVRYIKDCINGSDESTANSWNEIQAIYQGINIAKGKTVTSTGTIYTTDGTRNFESVTDGNFDNNKGDNAYINETGLHCVTVDLGQIYNLDEIAVWHYYLTGRTYKDNITYVSSDGSVWEHAITKIEAETANGKRVSAYEEDMTDEDAPTGTLSASFTEGIVTARFSNTSDNSGSGIKEYQYLITTDSTCPISGYTESTNNTYTFTMTAGGTYYVCARIKDNVGNISEPYSQKVELFTVNYDANMFSLWAASEAGVTMTYDPTTSYLTLNGTPTGSFPLMRLANQTFVEGEQYKATYNYISGNYTSTGAVSIVLETNTSSYASVSTRNNADHSFPTTNNNNWYLTVNSAAASEGSVLAFWVWVNEPGTLTFDNYKIKVNVTKVQSKTVENGDTYGTLPTPTRKNCVFLGWYTELNGGGTQITSSSVVNLTSDQTLYAHWLYDATPPTVNYSIAGGTYNYTQTLTITASDTGGSGYDYMVVEVYKNGVLDSSQTTWKNVSSTWTVTMNSTATWMIFTKVFDKVGNKQSQTPENGNGFYYQTYVINMYLYNWSDNSSITGGWIQTRSLADGEGSGHLGNMSFVDSIIKMDMPYIYDGNADGAVVTSNRIDLTYCSVIRFYVYFYTDDHTYTFRVGAFNDSNHLAYNIAAQTIVPYNEANGWEGWYTVDVNVSGLSGSYYVGVYSWTYQHHAYFSIGTVQLLA